MILEVNKIKGGKPLSYSEDVSFDEETFKCVLPLISVNSCNVKVNASAYSDFIEVQLEVNAKLTLQSSYSLKPFEYKLTASEEYHFSEYEEEGDDFIVFKGNRINLDEYIFNLISASIPLSPKAPGDTLPKGGKGYRVLTEEEFEKEKTDKGDSRFSKLDEIDFD